jgi:hypothetical protein
MGSSGQATVAGNGLYASQRLRTQSAQASQPDSAVRVPAAAVLALLDLLDVALSVHQPVSPAGAQAPRICRTDGHAWPCDVAVAARRAVLAIEAGGVS